MSVLAGKKSLEILNNFEISVRYNVVGLTEKYTLNELRVAAFELGTSYSKTPWHKAIDERIKDLEAKKENGARAANLGNKETSPRRLSPKIIIGYEKFDYKCYDRIFIPGAPPKRRSNKIIVNDHEMKLGDALFKLLLMLIVELKKGKGGWRLFNIRVGKHQPFSNLRTALAGSLIVKDGLNFIENDGSKRYRISVHPDYIAYDKEKLLKHPVLSIKVLVKELP